jgi:hypothetical protein
VIHPVRRRRSADACARVPTAPLRLSPAGCGTPLGSSHALPLLRLHARQCHCAAREAGSAVGGHQVTLLLFVGLLWQLLYSVLQNPHVPSTLFAIHLCLFLWTRVARTVSCSTLA